MTSWNDLFHKAEAGQTNSGFNTIHPAEFVNVVRTLDILVRKLAKADDAENPIDFKEQIAQLGGKERRLLSKYLLAAAEFYHDAKCHDAKIKVLGFVELLEKEYGISINRFDYQSN